jgi:hypothetical protein
MSHPFCRLLTGGVVALTTLAGCGSGNGPTDHSQSIAINLNQPSLSIYPGGVDSVMASVTRSGGFSGAVDLTVEGLPSGVTAAIGNSVVRGNVVTSAVTLTAERGVTPASYPATIVAHGLDVSTTTANIDVVVKPIPNIGILICPASLTLLRGETGQVVADLFSHGFTGELTISELGVPPAGVSLRFFKNSGAFLVSVSEAAALGSYQIGIQATYRGGPALADASFMLVVDTLPAPSPSVTGASQNRCG